MSAAPFDLDPRAVRRSFDRASRSSDAAAALQSEVRDRLLQRLEWVKMQPAVVVDLGCGTAHAAKALKAKFPKAQVVAVDIAHGMLREAAHQQRLFRKFSRVCADAARLPLRDQSVDLLFSNLMLHWCEPPDAIFAEARRVLQPRGLFIFTTFGPDTLKELRAAWAKVDERAHVHRFIDMHDLGDALVRARLAEPVLDIEYLTLTFREVRMLATELKAVGAHNASRNRFSGLTGRHRFLAMAQAYESFRTDGKIPATYEVVYGNAWRAAGPDSTARPPGEVHVPLARIAHRRRPQDDENA